MSAPASAQTNKALDPTKISEVRDAQAIVSQKYGTLDDVYLGILRHQLAPKVNDGKLIYLGIVTKILGADNINYSSHDFFRKSSYDIERQDGISDGADLSSKNLVFVHIPGLHTLISEYDSLENEEKNKITPSDLMKLPIETSVNTKEGDIIEVLFSSPGDLGNGKILSVLEKDDRRLKIQSKRPRGISALEEMSKFAACKLLQVQNSTGSPINNRIFLNRKAPNVGYFGLYMESIEKHLKGEELVENILLTMGRKEYFSTLGQGKLQELEEKNIKNAQITGLKQQLKYKIQFLTPSPSIFIAVKEQYAKEAAKGAKKIANPDVKFEEVIWADSSQSSIAAEYGFTAGQKNEDAFPDDIVTTAGDQRDRSVYLLVTLDKFFTGEASFFKPETETKYVDAIMSYLVSLYKSNFKCGVKKYNWEKVLKQNSSLGGAAILRIDIMENIKPTATVKDALDFTNLSIKKNYPAAGTGVQKSPVQEELTPTPGKDVSDRVVSLKDPLDECEDAKQILTELYIPASESARDFDNKKIKEILRYYKNKFNPKSSYPNISVSPSEVSLVKANKTKALGFLNLFSTLALAYDLTKYMQKSGKKTKWGQQFRINLSGPETMDYKPEIIKDVPDEKKKGKKAPPKLTPRSTSWSALDTNVLRINEFVQNLKQLISTNESTANKKILPENIIIVPLKTFRPYQVYRKNTGQPGPGHDRNSRHFYNRAIDFSVYIVLTETNAPNSDLINSLDEIPNNKNVFQIPPEIVYLYVLKLKKLTNSFKGGLALFSRANNQKRPYNHFETMEGIVSDIVSVERRWTNEPTKEEEKELIGQLFYAGSVNAKDGVVKRHVSRNYSSEIVGGLPQKIQFLID
jgi:hypothetical protein|tara:strand:- start:17265 stop:19841 length:2577 start_codon:yes stop_codon:yes gene_type:complete